MSFVVKCDMCGAELERLSRLHHNPLLKYDGRLLCEKCDNAQKTVRGAIMKERK